MKICVCRSCGSIVDEGTVLQMELWLLFDGEGGELVLECGDLENTWGSSSQCCLRGGTSRNLIEV